MNKTVHVGIPHAGNLRVRIDEREAASTTPRRGFLFCRMKKLLAASLCGMALITVVCASDLDWKCDMSAHEDASPSVGEATIASVLPCTAAVVNEAQAHTHVYDWLDSDGFEFDGQAPGIIIIFR